MATRSTRKVQGMLSDLVTVGFLGVALAVAMVVLPEVLSSLVTP